MTSTFIIGMIAGGVCTVSFIPQVVRAYRTKNTKDLSLPTFIAFSVGLILWLVYGVLLGQLPIIIANGLTLLLTFAIVIMKIRYG